MKKILLLLALLFPLGVNASYLKISDYTNQEQAEDKVISESVKLIKSFEWFHAKAYWDYKQYSVWYGQKAKPGQTITEKEASKFVEQRAKDIRKRFKFEKYDDKIEVALISFTYNIWRPPKWYDWYIKNWYYNALWNRMKQYKVCGWQVCGWLVKRRQAEVDYFINITK